MINVNTIIKRIDASDVGSSEYHYAMSKYCQWLATQALTEEEADGCLERATLQKLMGDTFKNDWNSLYI